MEGTYKFGRAKDSNSDCWGKVVTQAGNAFGAREARFPTEDTEEFGNCSDYYGPNFLTNNGKII
jgi:hypothetical protein